MNENKKISAVGTVIPSTDTENNSTEIINHAIEKINPKSVKNANRYMAAVAEPVAKALHGFCRQSTDRTFQECLETITKGIGQSISDVDIYQRAVGYYFPGAKIEFKMTIRMSEYETEEPEPVHKPKKKIDLSLDRLIDW